MVAKKEPAYMKGKYTEAKDKRKDAVLTRGLSSKEKTEFKKKDDAHGKKNPPKTMKQDAAIDKKIISGIKAKRKK